MSTSTEPKRKTPDSRQQYAKRPKYPGMATLGKDFSKLPLQKAKMPAEDVSRLDHVDSFHRPDKPLSLPESRLDFHRRVLKEIGMEISKIRSGGYSVDILDARPQASFGFRVITFGGSSDSPLMVMDNSFSDPNCPELYLVTMARMRLLYIRIMDQEAGVARLITSQKPMKGGRSLDNWFLRLSQTYQEFFEISQHEFAPEGIKRLAVKYALPERMWENNILSHLEFLRIHSPQPSDHISDYVTHTQAILDQLQINVPSLSQDWNMISTNLHKYLLQLENEGFQIRKTCLEYWPNRSESFTDERAEFMSLDFSTDQAYKEWQHYHKSVPPTSRLEPPDELKELYGPDAPPLRDSVLAFMDGWVSYGAKIAKDLYGYYKTFVFFGWTGTKF